MMIDPQKALWLLIEIIGESSKAFKIAFQEVQTGLQSHPDPFHLGEIPRREIMTATDLLKLEQDQKQRRSELLQLEFGTHKPSTKGGIEFSFGGRQPITWKFTDGLQILNELFQKPAKPASPFQPQPFYFKSNKEYQQFVKQVRLKTELEIKKGIDNYLKGLRTFLARKQIAKDKLLKERGQIIQTMLSEIEDICQPYFDVILPKYKANRSQFFDLLYSAKIWERNNLNQAYETLRRLLHFINSPLLDYYEKKNLNQNLRAWLTSKEVVYKGQRIKQDGIVAIYLKNIAAYDVLETTHYEPNYHPRYHNPNGLNSRGKPYQDDLIKEYTMNR